MFTMRQYMMDEVFNAILYYMKTQKFDNVIVARDNLVNITTRKKDGNL